MDSLEQLIRRLKAYEKVRGWDKNTSEDLAKSVVIEAAELLEHFQWDSTDKKSEKKDWEEIESEAADVFIYLLAFCYHNNIDLIEAGNSKVTKQEKKYPVEMFKGKHNSEFYKAQKAKYRKKKK